MGKRVLTGNTVNDMVAERNALHPKIVCIEEIMQVVPAVWMTNSARKFGVLLQQMFSSRLDVSK